MVSANGKFVYAANRLHDAISLFSIGRRRADLRCRGMDARRLSAQLQYRPTGNYFYSCNQRGDAIATFRIDRATGRLSFTGRYTPVGTPSSIVFLDLR